MYASVKRLYGAPDSRTREKRGAGGRRRGRWVVRVGGGGEGGGGRVAAFLNLLI